MNSVQKRCQLRFAQVWSVGPSGNTGRDVNAKDEQDHKVKTYKVSYQPMTARVGTN